MQTPRCAAASTNQLYRVVCDDGRYWFVRGDEQLLLFGVNCVDAGAGTTSGWARVQSWGFNVVAGWSDERLYAQGMPHTRVAWLGGWGAAASALVDVFSDEYLQRFTHTFGKPAHPILLFDLCRGIELVYAMERAIEMLSEDMNYMDTDVGYTPCDGTGYGLVEAPRGPLIHRYVVEKGLIVDAEFIIPTVHNMLAIERALRVAGKRYITPESVRLELEKAVGRVVRAFDPCIACATQ